METRSTTTTSVDNAFEASMIDADYISRHIMKRGEAEVHMDVDISAYLKPLSAKKEAVRTAADTKKDNETFDEIVEFNWGEQEETTRSLGRTALAPVMGIGKAAKWADRWSAYGVGWAISKMPKTMSLDERADYQAELDEKYAAQPGDSWYQRAKKFVNRNRLNIRDRALPYALGALAMSRVMPHALELGVDMTHGVSGKMSDAYDWLNKPRTVTVGTDMAANAIEFAPVEHIYDSKAIVVGGRGDTTSTFFYSSLEAQGVATNEADLVDSPAGIAPVDPVSMEVSSEIASYNATEFYNPNDPATQTIYGYSEGSAGAIKAYNDIVAANGGVKPDNLQLVLVGSPYAEGGFFKSDYVGVAGPVLNAMGIPTDLEVPPGATVIYSPNDFWANGDNQSFLGMMSQIADLGGSGHDPDVTGEFYMRVDENGVRHLIKKGTEHPLVELAEKQGMPLPPGASQLLQQIAPINNGMTDAVPQANAYAAYDIAGDIIDQQTGTPFGTQLMDAVPDSVKNLSQSGLTAINNIPGTAAGIANGTISPQEGVPIIMDQVQDVMTDVQPILADPVGTAEQFINDAVPPEAQPFVQPFINQGVGIANQFMQGFGQNFNIPR